MSRRSLAILAAVVAAVGLAFFAQRFGRLKVPSAVVPASRRDLVLARLGGSPPLATTPALETKRVRVGSATRQAVKVAAGASFTVPVVAGAMRVAFSFGTTADAPQAKFRVTRRSADEWVPLFEAAAKKDEWGDQLIELGGAASTQLRFEISGAAPADAPFYWGGIAVFGPEQDSGGPNIVVVLIDTLSTAHLSACGGTPGVSPNIDRFLNQSVTFDNTYAQYPNTLVSHASLFTGLYPRHHGVYATTPEVRSRTLATALADVGYTTAAFTEDAYVGSEFGFDKGFDAFDNGAPTFAEDFSGDASVTFDHAAGWLRRYGARSRFFLFVHTYEVHTPYTLRDRQAHEMAERIDPGYDGPFKDSYGGRIVELAFNKGEFPVPPNALHHLGALYGGEINYADRQLATLLAAIREAAPPRDTLVVLTSDHGEEFGEHGKLGHGETLYANALHVPLAFDWPGHTTAARIKTPVELIDVAPTLAELAGASFGEGVDGRSLAATLTGAAPFAERPGFSELQSAWGECERLKLGSDCRLDQVAVRHNGMRLISSMQPAFTRLYDLASDPDEKVDVAESRPADKSALENLVRAYREGKTATAPETKPNIDAATRERLRSLGYAD